ncbi:TPA: hypothetical protein PBT65_001756 [Staphylococcus aureus]|nr:hypothetical protein [Staphylococcus aureus]
MSNRSNNKRQQKENSKKARRYLKARFNEKIGYIFIAIWYFIRNNFIYHRNKIALILGAIALILLVFSTYNFVKASSIQKDINAYNKTNEKLENEMSNEQKKIDRQEKEFDDFNVSSSPKVVKTTEVLSQVFYGMYDYSDSKEYQTNRDKNMKYFEEPNSKEVKSIYNEDKDSADDSLIDNLNLKSSLEEFNVYTDQIKLKDSKTINLKAVVKYQSDILGVSSDFATRTHDTIYDIQFDTEKEKIKSIKKINTLKENKSVE